jgi:hypothetical protein
MLDGMYYMLAVFPLGRIFCLPPTALLLGIAHFFFSPLLRDIY